MTWNYQQNFNLSTFLLKRLQTERHKLQQAGSHQTWHISCTRSPFIAPTVKLKLCFGVAPELLMKSCSIASFVLWYSEIALTSDAFQAGEIKSMPPNYPDGILMIHGAFLIFVNLRDIIKCILTVSNKAKLTCKLMNVKHLNYRK